MAEPLLVLASGSPRRRELLGRFEIPFEVRPPDVDETARAGEAPADLVARLARAKAEAALDASPEPDVVALGSDTVVVLDDAVLGKPADAAEAASMLRRLSARTHVVLTGVAVARRTAPVAVPAGDGVEADAGPADEDVPVLAPAVALAVEVAATEVTFVELGDDDVAWYVASGEPLDKAGAYGIQGRASVFVASIRGNHDTVVGLPLVVVRRLLADVGLDPLAVSRRS